MNPYEVLGIKKSALTQDVRAAYRNLVKSTHPDGGGDPEDFKKIQEAYDILSDPDRRARYDETGKTTRSPVTPDRMKSFVDETMKRVVEAQRNDGYTDDPIFENIRDKIIAAIKADGDNVLNQKHQAYKKLERATRMLERFKPNSTGPDLVGDALRFQVEKWNAEIQNYEDALEINAEAQRIFRSYGYEVGPGSEGQYNPRPSPRRSGPLYLRG